MYEGLRRLSFGEDVNGQSTSQPVDALKNIKAREHGGMFLFCDLHPFLDGAISQDDVPEVSKAKMELLNMDGIISFESDTARFGEVAGLSNMKTWLNKRREAFLTATDDMRPKGRKGRLDEIFFVDLPREQVREDILAIHLKKRGLKPKQFDLPLLAEISDGFSGAELEQAIVSAWHTVKSEPSAKNMNTDILMDEIQRTQPLSVTMSERMVALRDWAEGRAVNAD
ncbi:MAG: hypothetical protein ACI910_002942 [Oleispira sp.]|jgi:hypothetical protein